VLVMEIVAILGAGAMGSALTVPLVRNGYRVHLWATELDVDLLAEMRAGRPHPRLGTTIAPEVHLFPGDAISAALDGATLVILAITSTAITHVYRRALPHMAVGVPMLIASKGFGRDRGGHVRLIPDLLNEEAPGCHPFVGIAGPCKANEVAAEQPTVAVFAAPDAALCERCRVTYTTDAYTVVPTSDLAGVELAAAAKNAYAISLGICDGLQAESGRPWHNLKAALFAQSVCEMATLCCAVGGRTETIYSFPGVGDLEVTGLSGRNRALGERLGRGVESARAIAEMEVSGQTVEGPVAARLAWALVKELEERGRTSAAAFPLLAALVRILNEDVAPIPLLARLMTSIHRQSGPIGAR
jgi:glycerol-3-phosphate dehydrogenase (NAD(P)+)